MNQEAVNRNVMERYVAAVQAEEPTAVRAFFADDASWTIRAGALPMSGTWKGRDRIMNGFFATAMSHYDPGSVELEVTAMIAQDDQVVLQWTSRARTKDGRPYENGCIGVFTIRDGRIIAVREYMDTLYVSDVLKSQPDVSGTVAAGG